MEEKTITRSFRVTDESIIKIKAMQDELGLTQDKAISLLIKTYEMEQAKNAIAGRAVEISNFQTKATELVEAFLNSVQLCQDTESRVRDEFATQIKSKETTIDNLNEKLTDLKASYDISIQQAAELMSKHEIIEKEYALLKQETSNKINDLNNTITDKENLNKALTDTYNNTKNELEVLKQQDNEVPNLKKEIKNLNDIISRKSNEFMNFKAEADKTAQDNLNALEIAKNECEKIRNEFITEMNNKDNENRKSLLDIETSFQQQIIELKEKHASEIETLKDTYHAKIEEHQNKYMELIEKLNSKYLNN